MLGPLLFLLYVNDITEIVTGVKIKLFANDIIIFAERVGKDKSDCVYLFICNTFSFRNFYIKH